MAFGAFYFFVAQGNESFTMIKRRKTFAVVILLLLGGLLVLWVNRVTIAVRYHLAAMDSSWRRIAEVGANDPKQSMYIDRYDAHRDALVRYGYFERREFVLTHISVPSTQSKRLWQELQAMFPDHPHVTMQGYEPATTDMVTVWDRPASMSRWKDVIQAHDKSSAGVALPGTIRE